MRRRPMRWALVAAWGVAAAAQAQVVYDGRARTMSFELKFGGYRPLIGSEAGLSQDPYAQVFGSGTMLLFEMEADRYLWQKYGAAGVGFSAGYAEKYGRSQIPAGVIGSTSEKTSLKVVPLQALALYRFDYAALHWNIPLVPYLKLGLVYEPWWVAKGAHSVEYENGVRGAGGKWGAEVVGGLAFLLDFLEPRFASDFHSDTGISHTYLFGDFTYADVNDFGAPGLVLSSRHFMFGISFEY